MLKRFFVSSVCAAAVLAMTAGCGKKADSAGGTDAANQAAAAAGGGKALTLAVIPKSTGGEYWETVGKGAKAAAADLGVTIKWEGTLAETEIAEQNKIIENMVNLGVDGMALAPLNQKAMRKGVEQTVAAGIPVVIFDSSVEGDAQTSFVATDNKAGGALAGTHMVNLLSATGGKKVLVLRYLQGTGSTEARAEGFIGVAKSAGLEIVASPYCEDGTVAGAKKASTNSLEAYVQDGKLALDGVFACNLYSALGMAAALGDLRKSGVEVKTTFIGFDTSPKLLEELHAGNCAALVSQNPERMGYLAVETLVKHLRGEKVAATVDTGVELVTEARLKEDAKLRALVGE